MKKTLITIYLILGLLMFSACSQDNAASASPFASVSEGVFQKTASGIVESMNVYQITASFAGILCPFDLKQGDAVKNGDVLFTLDTNKVYAPCYGTIGSMRAIPGDNAEVIQARYGALCYIEPKYPLLVNASINGAYNLKNNKFISAGEKLYIKKVNSGKKGSGNVISVKDTSYVVEINKGSFKIGDFVNLYLKSNYNSKSKAGTGIIARTDPIAVVSQGSVLKVYAKEGQPVQRGDLLFETIMGNIGSIPKDNSIRAQKDGILGNIAVSTGQFVQQGQLLASVYDNSALCVNASVDEMDLGKLAVGDTVSIVFDSISDKRYSEKVEYISNFGVQKQNASFYNVRITLTPDAAVRIGMSATVYMPGK